MGFGNWNVCLTTAEKGTNYAKIVESNEAPPSKQINPYVANQTRVAGHYTSNPPKCWQLCQNPFMLLMLNIYMYNNNIILTSSVTSYHVTISRTIILVDQVGYYKWSSIFWL